MQDHRNPQDTSRNAQGARATGTQAQRAAALGSCGPAPAPQCYVLLCCLVLLLLLCWVVRLCYRVAKCVCGWLESAWRRAHVVIPDLVPTDSANPVPTLTHTDSVPLTMPTNDVPIIAPAGVPILFLAAPPADVPVAPPLRRAPVTAQRRVVGLHAVIFGANSAQVLTNGGAPFRSLLRTAGQCYRGDFEGEGLAMAVAALAMGRVQWLGDTSAPASATSSATRVRLAGLPCQYQAALLANRDALGRALRQVLNWRLVVCDNGVPVQPQQQAASSVNRFGMLSRWDSELRRDVQQREQASNSETNNQPAAAPSGRVYIRAPLSEPVNLQGLPADTSVVRKRFGRKLYWGVAQHLPQEPEPYTYQVRYTDLDQETMTKEEVSDCMAYSWDEVPRRLRTQLTGLAHQLSNTAPAIRVPQVTVQSGTVIRKKWGGRSGRTYYGVVAHDATASMPYVYTVSYEDGDFETMCLREVRSYLLPQGTAVPARVSAVLRLLGADLPNTTTGTTAPAARPTTAAPVDGGMAPRQDEGQVGGGVDRAEARRRRRRAAGLVRAAQRTWTQAGLNVTYVNICGLTAINASELQDALKAFHVDILGVTETWEGKCQPHAIPGYNFISKPRREQTGGGVGFYVARTLTPLVLAHYNTVLPESLWLQVNSRRRNVPPMFVGLVYLPPSSLESAAAIETTYQQLKTDILDFKARGTVIVLGDFNSKIGKADAAGQHIGEWGGDDCDRAGEALRELLQLTDLYTLNNRCQQGSPHAPAYTRRRLVTDADGTTTEQCSIIDYVLMPADYVFASPPALRAPCTLQVVTDTRFTGADHMLLHFCLPHPVTETPAPTLTLPKPKTWKLTLPRDALPADAQAERDSFPEVMQLNFAEYPDFVASLEEAVVASTLTAMEACQKAKEHACMCMHATVEATIGYARPRRSPCVSPPHVRTPAVRAAVQARDQAAADCVSTTNSHAPDTPEVQQAQQALKQAQAALKTEVNRARAEHTSRIITRIHSCRKDNDGKGMWAGLKTLAGTRQIRSTGPAALQNPAGPGLLTNDQAISNTLATHYERVSSTTSHYVAAPFDPQHRAHIEAQVTQYRSHSTDPTDASARLSDSIAASEVKDQCMRLNNNKAPSPFDCVHNEVLKYGGEGLHEAMAALFNLQFKLEVKAKTCGVITPIYKRGDPTDPKNFRPITLGSAIDKLYNLVLNDRICKYLEDNNKLHDAQQGFRPGRSAVDNIYMLKTCLDARCQRRLDTYLLFVDIEKAYDTVWRAGLLWHLWQKGIQGRMFRVLAQMLDDTPCVVMHNGAYSHVISPDMGWEQGDTLATTMFNVFIDSVLQHVWAEHAGISIPSTSVGLAKLVALMYADDMVGFAVDAPQMQALIDCTRTVLNRWQLRASVNPSDASKTAVLKVRGGPKAARIHAAARGVAPQVRFTWGDVVVPSVKGYKYLGVWVNETNTWDEHFRMRKQSAAKAAGAHHKIMTQVRLPVHLRKLALTTVVQPVLTYAAQVWAQTSLRRDLDSWQMGLATRAFHCPSTASHLCLQQEIGLCPLHVTCETLAIRYWHHLQHVPPDRLLHTVSKAWPAGKCNPWASNMGKLLRQYGVDEAVAASYGTQEFHGYLAGKAMAYLKSFWSEPPRSYSLAVHSRYTESFGVGTVAAKNARMRKYLGKLTAVPGYTLCKGAELCMHMRLECLPLNAMRSHTRRGESAEAKQLRERCPCCQQAAETPAHFLFECSAYTQLRSSITGQIQHAHDRQDMAPWRALLAFEDGAFGPTASFVLAAWQRRRAVLNGREANGVSHSMALPPELADSVAVAD